LDEIAGHGGGFLRALETGELPPRQAGQSDEQRLRQLRGLKRAADNEIPHLQENENMRKTSRLAEVRRGAEVAAVNAAALHQDIAEIDIDTLETDTALEKIAEWEASQKKVALDLRKRAKAAAKAKGKAKATGKDKEQKKAAAKAKKVVTAASTKRRSMATFVKQARKAADDADAAYQTRFDAGEMSEPDGPTVTLLYNDHEIPLIEPLSSVFKDMECSRRYFIDAVSVDKGEFRIRCDVDAFEAWEVGASWLEEQRANGTVPQSQPPPVPLLL
jgi:hypothetical protein